MERMVDVAAYVDTLSLYNDITIADNLRTYG